MTPAPVGCAAPLRTPFAHLATPTKGSLEKSYCCVVGLERSFNHASRADGALPFLCFAKEKEAKERRPRRAGLLRRLPSLRILFSARAN